MTKRASLPRADELFRPTAQPTSTSDVEETEPTTQSQPSTPAPPTAQAPTASPTTVPPQPVTEPNPQVTTLQTTAPEPEVLSSTHRLRAKPTRRFVDKPVEIQVPRSGSGRQQHEEKITFYCTAEELLALERARLALRQYGVGVDRGRIIREALSITLEDLDRSGADAILVERLAERHMRP